MFDQGKGYEHACVCSAVVVAHFTLVVKGGTSGGAGGAKTPPLFVIGEHSPTTFSGSIKRVTQLVCRLTANLQSCPLSTVTEPCAIAAAKDAQSAEYTRVYATSVL